MECYGKFDLIRVQLFVLNSEVLFIHRYLRQLNLESDLVTAKNFKYYDPLSEGKALVLDGQTLAHIEVLQNSSGGIEGTLFQLLSRCVTPFGRLEFVGIVYHVSDFSSGL